MLDGKTGKFIAQKGEITLSDEKLKELRKKIDKYMFKREKGFAYVGWLAKIFECEKTSEVEKSYGVKYYRVSYVDEIDGRKRWMEVRKFIPYSEKVAKLVKEYNSRLEEINKLSRENEKLLKKIFEGD